MSQYLIGSQFYCFMEGCLCWSPAAKLCSVASLKQESLRVARIYQTPDTQTAKTHTHIINRPDVTCDLTQQPAGTALSSPRRRVIPINCAADQSTGFYRHPTPLPADVAASRHSLHDQSSLCDKTFKNTPSPPVLPSNIRLQTSRNPPVDLKMRQQPRPPIQSDNVNRSSSQLLAHTFTKHLNRHRNHPRHISKRRHRFSRISLPLSPSHTLALREVTLLTSRRIRRQDRLP